MHPLMPWAEIVDVRVERGVSEGSILTFIYVDGSSRREYKTHLKPAVFWKMYAQMTLRSNP